jgi:hypothetical protein
MMLARNRKFDDSPLEETVWSEPVSATRFPGYWEKCREAHSIPMLALVGSRTNQGVIT